jgi:tol-pal system protein YbgF
MRRAAAFIALCLLAAAPARAALFEDDEARKAIVELRARVAQNEEQARTRAAELAKQMNAQISEQLQVLRNGLLDMNTQLESMRAEIARLRCGNEQLQRDVAQLKQELAAVQRKQLDIGQTMDERLARFEPQKVSLDGKDFVVEADEKRQYDEAIALLRAGDFDKANNALAAFQKRWPNTGYVDSARYWQGIALYGKRDYKEAITTFRAVVSKAPEHLRAPDALLAIANSQAEMKDNRAARKTIEELLKTYPKSEAATAGKERLASLK